jgi:hypothetical protein
MAEPAGKGKARNLTGTVIDLTTVPEPSAAIAEAAPSELSEPFSEKPYDPLPERENIRGQIAQWLIWTLVGVIACVVLTAILTTIGCLKTNACDKEALGLPSLRAVVELILTPLVGLVGAVTGFYFGEKSATAKPEPGGS